MANELDRLRGEVGDFVAKHAKKGRDFSQYANDPVGFLRDVLHFAPWSAQVEMAELVRDHPRVCIVSANSIGKDALISRLALWWVYCRNGLVVLTSVTDRQARHISMKEVRRAFLGAPSLPGELFQMELRVDDDCGIVAFTSDHVERLVGWHHPRLLLCLSEGQGLEPDVFEAAHACATSDGNRIVCYGNPTRPVSPFHTAATSANWRTLTIPATAHPNIVNRCEEIPGGPSLAWIASMADEYGEASSIFRARVLAEWPDDSIEGLFKRSWIEAAFQRYESGALDTDAWRYVPPGAVDRENPLSAVTREKLGYSPLISADVGRFGADPTMLAIVRGPKVESFVRWHGMSTTDSGGLIVQHAERLWTNRQVARPRLVVDDTGVGGGVTDDLRRRGWGVLAHNNANKASDPARYLNVRAESYWRVARALEAGAVALPRDEQLAEELLATEYQLAPSGAIQIVSKDDIKKTLGRSPDKADAVTMGLHQTLPHSGTAARLTRVF